MIECIRLLEEVMRASAMLPLSSTVSLGYFLISDLVVTNLFMHSLRCDSTLFGHIFFTLKVFLHEI